MQKTLKAVLFDLDGVIVNTSKFHFLAWKKLADREGIYFDEAINERLKGVSRMDSLEIILERRKRDYSHAEKLEMCEKKNNWYMEMIEKLTPGDILPGVKDVLDSAKKEGIRIALCSASKNAGKIISKLGLYDYFDTIVDGNDIKRSKPDPEVFLLACERLGISPEECAVIEDAYAGIEAAKAGGMKAVGIGSGDILSNADIVYENMKRITIDDIKELWSLWTVSFNGIYENRESSIHTLLCTGNGRIGIRGTIPELEPGDSQGIFLGGFYDKLTRPLQNPDLWSPFLKYWSYRELALDRQIETCLVKCPDFLDMKWKIDGEEVNFNRGRLISLKRELDMKSGTFCAKAHWVSDKGKEIRLIQKRFASMAKTDRVFVSYELELLNCSAAVEITGGISTNTRNTTISGIYRNTCKDTGSGFQRLYDVVEKKSLSENSVEVTVKGSTDKMEAAFATILEIQACGDKVYETITNDNGIFVRSQINVKQNEALHIERAAIFSLSLADEKPTEKVETSIYSLKKVDFLTESIENAACWRKLWNDSDICVDGDPKAQLSIRFSIFNLLAAGPRDISNISIGAKGLTGEGYRGMVFWDTDIHIKPFYDFTQPDISRNLALFRYNTLDGARKKAERYGFKGASYPWETGISGEEECEKFLKLITHQLHITVDVVYALKQYYDCTNDMEFYLNCAAEVFIETARFWVSKAVPDGSAVSIPDASGPDELHIESCDSAYVNNLARYNLELAEEAIDYLKKKCPQKWLELKNRTGITDEEIEKIISYKKLIRTMKHENGLFEQCRGFFALKDEIVDEDGEIVPKDTQTVKQADVIMLLYLMPGLCTREELRKNWDYYEPRTTHSSSLSFGVHGIIAAELGLADKARYYIDKSLGIDLYDEMGNASEGIHMAASGMSWSAIVNGYAGARPINGKFRIEPRLPSHWKKLQFTLKWKGADFTVVIDGSSITVTNKPSAKASLPLVVKCKEYSVRPGETVCI